MLENRAEIPAESPPHPRGKHRLLTLEAMDGRTIAARRARELAQGFEAELGGTMTASQRLAIERAAALVALAEDAKARRLAGDQGVTLDDVVRVDGAAARAVKALGMKPGAAVQAPPTIKDYIAARPLKPADGEFHHGPSTVRGEASDGEPSE